MKQKVLILIFLYMISLKAMLASQCFLAPNSSLNQKKMNRHQKIWEKLTSVKMDYSPHTVRKKMTATLKFLESQNKLGTNILELGSSVIPFATNTFSDKRVCAIDVGFNAERSELTIKPFSKTLFVKGDIQNLSEIFSDHENKSSIHSLMNKPDILFDTIILSDVLNYVDYKKVIWQSLLFLKPGGRIITFNMAGVGYEKINNVTLFISRGVKKNSALLDFIKQTPLNIEYQHDTNEDFAKEIYSNMQRQIIVAQKLLVTKDILNTKDQRDIIKMSQ